MFKSLSLVSLGGCCQKVEVTHSSSHLKNIYDYIYGTYTLSGVINDQNYYISDGFDGSHAIWWCSTYSDWVIGDVSKLGQCDPYAYLQTNKCVDTSGYDWVWRDYTDGNQFKSAEEGLKIVCWNPGKLLEVHSNINNKCIVTQKLIIQF